MGSWLPLLLAYLLGGITFIPLVLVSLLASAYFASPYRSDADPSRPGGSKTAGGDATDSIVLPGDDTTALDEAKKEAAEKPQPAVEYLDVAAGYFAVCREYVPMGVNSKPIERSTPVGSTTVAAPSPSVYQTMYRSIFDRKAAPAGPVDNNSMNQRPRRAGNLFYLVLRHGHVMLFDDEEQIEVRHVISLAHHDISVYSGGDVTPEGELFIKRNALCLSRRTDGVDLAPDSQVSKPFYLFSDNCSAKEDFYFALLRNQEQAFGATMAAPNPKHFDVKNIISLVQKLHSTEENVHSRWLNAMLGRMFLSVHKTRDIESFISDKIAKKISRVKRPSFLTNIHIRSIDTGEAAPFFTNMKLKDLSVEGECVMEADVKYTGNFRIEVATTAKIDLGARFKPREVNLVLSLVLRKIEGHVLFKIKPPPSNRIWLSFQTMPKIEMTVEPIVSARQITYTLILRQIESRIKEVVAETLVQPFWDDVPFFGTEHKRWRGGIFEGDDAVARPEKAPATSMAQAGDADAVKHAQENADPSGETRPPIEKSHSMPNATEPAPPSSGGLFGRKISKTPSTASQPAVSTGASPRPRSSVAPTPKTLNHAPEPVVATDSAHADLFKPSTSPPDHATNYMAALQSRSQDASPATTPAGSPEKRPAMFKRPSISSAFSTGNKDADGDRKDDESEKTSISAGRRNTSSSADSASAKGGNTTSAGEPQPAQTSEDPSKDPPGSPIRNFWMRREGSGSNLSATSVGSDSNASTQKKNALAAVSNAAIQARQWGWNAIQRQKGPRKNSDPSSQNVDLSQPMGRGQPLPPPGTPLPGPANGRKKMVPIPVPKSKMTAPGVNVHQETSSQESLSQHSLDHQQWRRRRQSHSPEDQGEQSMLVVAAPDDSDLETPDIQERKEYYLPSEAASISGNADGAADGSQTARTPASLESTLPVNAVLTSESSPNNSVPGSMGTSRTEVGGPTTTEDQETTEAFPKLDASPEGNLGENVEADPVIYGNNGAVSGVDNGDDDDFSGWMEYDQDYEVDDAPKQNVLQSTSSASSITQENSR